MDIKVAVDNSDVGSVLFQTFILHKDLVLGIIIGILLIILYHRFIGERSLRKSYERMISDKDDHINDLKAVVLERLEAVTVDAIDPKLFKGIKRYFKKGKNK